MVIFLSLYLLAGLVTLGVVLSKPFKKELKWWLFVAPAIVIFWWLAAALMLHKNEPMEA